MWKTRDLWGAFATAACVWLVVACPAQAQDRPSFSSIQAATCTYADEAGHGYRPVYCDPRCGCLEGLDLAKTSSCAETVPGTVQVAATSPPHDATCYGFCSNELTISCASDDDCLLSGGTCTIASPQARCVDDFLGDCESDAECPPNFACQTLQVETAPPDFTAFVDRCVDAAGCFVPGVCASGLIGTSFDESLGLGVPGDLAPLACSALPGNINSNDSRECIAQVEAAWGQPCALLCGNGAIDGDEECDDGNTTPGDGCDAYCGQE